MRASGEVGPRLRELGADPQIDSAPGALGDQGTDRKLQVIGSFLRQVLEQVQPALPRADEVEVAVAVDVDGRDLQARPGGPGGEIFLGVPFVGFWGRSWPARPGRSRA